MYASFDADRLQQIEMCVEIGLQCVEHEREKRPPIVDIVDKLNGSTQSKWCMHERYAHLE
jgi:hypothetical protein